MKKRHHSAFRRTAVISAAIIFCGVIAAAAAFYHGQIPGLNQSQTSSSALPSSSQTKTPSSSKSVPKPVSITILGAGDDLIHSTIYNRAKKLAGGKGYDFDPMYERVAGRIQTADIAVVNQESILASKVAPISGYPLFNSPTEVGDELVHLGFDVINQANNHVLDMGQKGIKAALDYWDTQPVTAIGAYRNDADLQNIRIVESKGIKTAQIGITEMTNGLYLPKDSDYRIVYASDTELIKSLIQKAKSMADVVVISVHWGTEDTYTLTDQQKKLAQEMVDWGADIIFGNHPHVVQQLTLLTRASDGAKCPVIFAFGNFISGQLYGRNMVSGLLTVTMTKNFETGKTVYSGMKFEPIVTHYETSFANLSIYPLSEYSETLASKHGVRKRTPEFSMRFIQDIIDQNIPKEYQAES
ncbi:MULTISPECIES: CapA family protein [Acutalibacteraceae]|uniref:CapA family protein n=1 Tax=Acutalibacteraceae TaxID=3082771 RepID=UPI0013E8BF3C|nr:MULTISPECIES: CapA family protein [Acutalibacteraceae]